MSTRTERGWDADWLADQVIKRRWQTAPHVQQAVADAPKPLRLTPTTEPESSVLKTVLIALRLNPRVAWCERMNSGAYSVGDRFVRFGFKGCSDIIGQLKTGQFLAVECKRVGSQPTEAQVEFLGLVERSGGVAFVARNIDDVIARLS